MFNIEKIIPSDSKINFLRIKNVMILISTASILITIILLFFNGLNLGIDFKGGVLIEAETKNIEMSELRNSLTNKFDDVTIQEFGSPNNIIIRLQNKNNIDNLSLINDIKNLIGSNIVEFRRSEFVGPTISNELFINGLMDGIISLYFVASILIVHQITITQVNSEKRLLYLSLATI